LEFSVIFTLLKISKTMGVFHEIWFPNMELNTGAAGFIRGFPAGATAGYGIHVQLQNSAENSCVSL
jgi:hypothetical protein